MQCEVVPATYRLWDSEANQALPRQSPRWHCRSEAVGRLALFPAARATPCHVDDICKPMKTFIGAYFSFSSWAQIPCISPSDADSGTWRVSVQGTERVSDLATTERWFLWTSYLCLAVIRPATTGNNLLYFTSDVNVDCRGAWKS